MGEHSKGEWRYIGEEDNDFVVYVGDEFLCNVGEDHPSPGVTVAFDIKDQANARLITASPEMLKALIDIRKLADFTTYEGPKIAGMADFAIEKATREAKPWHCTDCGDVVEEGVEMCEGCTEERVTDLHYAGECVINCPVCKQDREGVK